MDDDFVAIFDDDEEDRVERRLGRLERHVERLEHQMASEQQADVDALTAAVQADVANIQAEITALEAQVSAGTQPDLTALKAAVDQLGQVAPAPPAPTTP